MNRSLKYFLFYCSQILMIIAKFELSILSKKKEKVVGEGHEFYIESKQVTLKNLESEKQPQKALPEQIMLLRNCTREKKPCSADPCLDFDYFVKMLPYKNHFLNPLAGKKLRIKVSENKREGSETNGILQGQN